MKMKISEKEAKQRVCPMSISTASVHTNCIGSHCMAWRWVGKEDEKKPYENQLGFCGMTQQFPSR